jgi:hypothetical protein
MDELKRPRTRRALIMAAAGGAAALAVRAATPMGVAAHDPDDLQLNAVNSSPGTTTLNCTALDTDALVVHGANATTGSAILAVGAHAPGIRAYSGEDAAIYAINGDESGAATQAQTMTTGAYGYAPTSPDPATSVGAGVWGDSADIGVVGTGGLGVFGSGNFGVEGDGYNAQGQTSGGVGVAGYAGDPGTVGVFADAGTHTDRTALRVLGKVAFSRSGRTTISAGASSKKITLAGVTSGSLVFASLASNRSGRYVRAVVPTTGSFTIYLNTSVTSASYLVWWVIN